MCSTINALRGGEIVDLGGIKFRMDTGKTGEEVAICAGDLYIAERNTDPKLLTAAKVFPPRLGCGDGYGGWIRPTSADYSFDTGECVKVVEVV